jgi:PAS domain S-box-containing protein
MYHPQLLRLLEGLSPEMRQNSAQLEPLLHQISQRFLEYDRNVELLEHASSIAEKEYEDIYRKFKETTAHLDQLVERRTAENDELIQFPLQNPNPVISTDLNGVLLFQNKAADLLKEAEYQNKKFAKQDFFSKIIPGLKDAGSFEIRSVDKVYLVYYIKIEKTDRINFYFSDITELWDLQQKSYDNFYRLNNFLEATDSVHYIVYSRQSEKNFFTSRWPLLFGFNPNKSEDPLLEKRAAVLPHLLKDYDEALHQMELSGNARFKYQIENKITKKTLWIEEEIKKRYDPFLKDEVMIGKITDVTSTELYKDFIAESESRFKNITDSLPVMTWVSDQHNRVTYSNQQIKEFFGRPLEEIKGHKEFEAYIHPSYRNKAAMEWQDKLQDKKKVSVEFLLMGADGKYHFIHEVAIPRFLPNGEFVGYIGSFFDLTKEYEYNLQLEADKKQFELIALNASDITVITDWQGKISYISPGVKRLLDYEEKELTGQNIFSYFCDESKTMLQPMVSKEMFEINDTQTFSFKLTKRDGDTIWVEAVMAPFIQPNQEDDSQAILMHIRDIHEQYTAFEALKNSEERYRTLFQNMQLGILQVDQDERIVFVNSAMEKIAGYTSDEMIGKKTPELLLTSAQQKEHLSQVLGDRKRGKASVYELLITKKNGETAQVVVSGVPLLDANGKFTGGIGINWDVTELRRMEAQLTKAKIDREKQIIEARLQAEEEQRAQIGRDLHDGVGQMLAYITLYLNVVKSNASYGMKELLEIEKTVTNTLEQVRTLSRTLTPPAIRDLGLRDSVIELIDSYGILTKPVFQLNVYAQKNEERIPLDVKIVVYRILQELLNNTFKYAKAETITIKFSFIKEHLCLDYADDGSGFDLLKQRRGVGLDSMNSRVDYYKGTIDIKSAPGKGTRVSIKIPCPSINIKKAETTIQVTPVES